MSIFQTLSNIWTLLLAWMPPAAAVCIILLFGLIAIIIIIKIIAFILDAIPFL